MSGSASDQPLRLRPTRRRFLATSTLAGTSAAFLAACSSSNNSNGKAPTAGAQPSASRPPGAATAAIARATSAAGVNASPSAATPKKGGELVLSVSSANGNQPMDPHISLNKAFYYWGLVSEKLVDMDHQKFEPLQGQLVEKWEQPDPSSLLLTVRQGVSWHEGKITNGRPFTAKDAAFNVMRMAAKLDPDRKAQFQRASLLNGMDKAEAVDDKTVKVSFTTPNSQFLVGIADFRQLVVPQELVDKDPNFKSVADFAGTGAFIIQSYDEASFAANYTANSKYWRSGQPYVASIKQAAFADTISMIAAFLAGKISIPQTASIPQSDRTTIMKSRPDAKIINYEFELWPHMELNQTRDAFKDPRVRKAVQLALNYKDLLDANFGAGFYDYTGPIPSGLPGAWSSQKVQGLPGWNPATKAQDIADAKKLLEAAGFPNGKGLSFKHFSNSLGVGVNFPVIVKDQLEKAFTEIKVALDPAADGADFASRQVKGDFDACDYSFQSIPSAILEAQVHYRTDGSRNYTRFSDPQVDGLIDKGFIEFDANARNQLVDQIEQKLLDDMLIITFGKPRYGWATDPKLQGLEGYSGPGSQGSYDSSFAARQLWFA